MQKMKAKALTAMLLMAIVIAVLPLTVNASTGYIRIDPTTISVPAGGNVNLNFTEVLFSGGQFYLILSTNGFSDQTGTQYSMTFGVSQLQNSSVTTYTSGTMSWKVGYGWVNGSIPLNIAGGQYFIKAFDGAATSVAVTDVPITVTATFTVTPVSGTAGRALTLAGYAFGANAKVNITYLNTTGTNYIPVANLVQADSVGQFTYPYAAPDLMQLVSTGNSTYVPTRITFNAKDVPGAGYNATYDENPRGLYRVQGSATQNRIASTSGTYLWGNATDFTGAILVERQVNETIRIVGLNFYPGTATIWWDAVTVLGTATVNSTGGFDTTITVPLTGVGGHWIVVQDAGVLFYARVYVSPTLILNPTRGPIGTTVAVTAYGFPASVGTTVYNATITWIGTPTKAVAWALISSTGQFTTSFVVPSDYGGLHDVVVSVNASTVTATSQFYVTPQLTVAPSTFANNCTFVVTVSGTGFDPEASWIFYVDNAFYSNWFYPASNGTLAFHLASGGFRPGMHKVHVIANDGASPYAIEAYATFTVTEGNDIETDYLKQINATVTGLSGLSGVNASMINDIYTNTVLIKAQLLTVQGDVATIKTDTGIIKANVTTMMPQITNINNGVASIQTTMGTMTSTLATMQATLTSVNNQVGTISTTLGDVTTQLSNINMIVTATGTTLVDVQTDVGTIKGTVTAIEGDVATIQTDIGTLTTDVADVQTSVDGLTNTLSIPIYIAVALALVAAIAAIMCLIMMRRKIAG